VGTRVVDSYQAQHRALVSMQLGKIRGAKEIGLLSEFDYETGEGNLIYVDAWHTTV
jgi:hypothetical protein